MEVRTEDGNLLSLHLLSLIEDMEAADIEYMTVSTKLRGGHQIDFKLFNPVIKKRKIKRDLEKATSLIGWIKNKLGF